ncbi:mitochondria protoheme IX farnesyltransferase [Amniculicola lignicola CBS 123094]|uniref:Protoheme IX farnesyltransferase, mitochondrial n=1 Tax=Amniculicola lignicola CBS 123094 TaxID=1392246 RepID=A0A6A5X3G4_9PLEO|nr:mitochondria protoheme IX farnesyltransferase [Amniculicola lignicola CBS 123094]
MTLRPPLPRSIALRDASSVCLKCWRRLGGVNGTSLSLETGRKRMFSVGVVGVGSGSGNGSGNGKSGSFGRRFERDYFWANNAAREGFWRASMGGEGMRGGGGGDISTTTSKAIREAPIESGAQDEVLPHRRRKTAREEEASTSPEGNYPIALDASSKLATASAALPDRSLRRLLTIYLSLSKPRLSFLVVLTATAAYSLYPVPGLLSPAATATPSLSTLTLLFLTTGTALCSSAANAFNMLMEPQHDAKMTRTRNRPLVRKLISTRNAMFFAIACAIAGTGALYYGVNPTTAFLGASNIVLYAAVYTPLKRISVLNTWVGAIIGGIPPLMGWTAAAGQYALDGGWQELLLSKEAIGGWLSAALLFAWQFPHFNALSWSIRDEYKNAGYRMLSWVNPSMNSRVALRYSILMFPICFYLSYVGVTEWAFVGASAGVNGWMVYKSYLFWKLEGKAGSARGLFWASVWHLPIVMVLAMGLKKGLGERVWRGLVGWPDLGEEEEGLYYEDGEGVGDGGD